MVPSGVHITNNPGTMLEATADAAGIYTITFRGSYGGGCSHDYEINVVVPYVGGLRYALNCNQTAGGYNVTLYDHSTQFPLTPITTRTFYQTPSTVIGTGSSVTVFQPSGTTRYYYIEVGDSYGLCPSEPIPVTTPVFPSAAITLDTASPNPGCVNDVVFNFHRTTAGSNLGYYWNFGDASFNAGDYDPMGRVYTTPTGPIPNHVTLTVTDEYGCSVVSDTVDVNVKANPLSGSIAAAPTSVCPGDPVTLTYSQTSGGLPNSYTWYRENTPLFTTLNNNTYQVYVSGGYWVLGTGDFGCTISTNLASVNVNSLPTVSIMGNAQQCVGETFTLQTQDYGGGYSYTWSGAGSGSGTGSTILTQTINTPGTYTYYMTLTDIITGCSTISPAFIVTVSAPPAPPTLDYDVVTCQPYELKIYAIGAPGVYNWNNGMTGSTILTPFGGPYQVTLTDDNGCVVQNSINVPKSPEVYLWVFPTGCFCLYEELPYLIGPIPFFNWSWLENGNVVAANFGPVPPLYITPGNVYNMVLDDGNCSVTSGDMYYQTDTCTELGLEGRPAVIEGAETDNLLQKDDYNGLVIAPNPAKDRATVTYRFAKGGSSRSIELLDMTGRLMKRYLPAGDQGSIIISLTKYAAGMYQIVMRRDGQVVQQGRLSVIR